MKKIFQTSEGAYQPPATGFQKNDWFKTLVRLKAHFTGIPVDDFPADSRTRRLLEIFRMVLPPEPLNFPEHENEKEQEFLV
jgi:hypothetical protein